jgi:hypothetical protein
MNTATALHILPTADPVEVKETALVALGKFDAPAVFLEGDCIDELLAACEERAMTVTTDASTAKGRAEIKSMAYLVARTKTAFDVPGKALSAEYKEKPKIIDGNRKKVADYLEDLQKRVRKPLTDWEEAEKARVQGIKDRIEVIRQHAGMSEDSAMVKAAIARLEAVAIDESFAEFVAEAAQAKDKALAILRADLEYRLKREAEAAELKRLREEAAKREQAEREAKIVKEAAEKATRDAEEKARLEKAESETRELRAKLAQEQAEKAAAQAIADAEAKAKQAVEDERKRQAEADRQKQAEIDRINAEADRRAADEANRTRIHFEIRDYLMSEGLPQSNAAAVVSLLATGSIPHVSVRY